MNPLSFHNRKLRFGVGIVWLLIAVGAARAEPREDIPLTLSATVPQYCRQEVTFHLRHRPVNPYDPDEIAVDGIFSAPSGAEFRVPAFFFEAHDAFTGEPRRESAWKLRFAPAEVGTYVLKLIVSRRGGPAEEVSIASFRCVPSVRQGFITTDGRRFATTTGGDFFPIGANRCWGDLRQPRAYLADMERLAAAGANCIRVWLAPWWLPIEEEDYLYNQTASGRLDAIMSKAESLGLRVILCVEQHGNFEPEGWETGRWGSHPYNAANGGPCRTTTEFFTEPEARRRVKNRLRYLAARWGYSTSLMAWELFNEVELVPFQRDGFYGENREAVETWHREMAAFLRERDPFGHLVATSSDVALQEALLSSGSVDFLQLHVYDRDEPAVRLRELLESLAGRLEAPVLVGEFGLAGGEAESCEFVTRGIFTSALAGLGTGALPWLQDVQDTGPAYLRLAAARRFFLRKIRWREGNFVPVEPEILAKRTPEIEVIAIRGTRETILYAFAHDWEAGERVTFRIPGVTAGTHVIEVWDPARGKVLYREDAEAIATGLSFTIPDFRGEIAVRIERRRVAP